MQPHEQGTVGSTDKRSGHRYLHEESAIEAAKPMTHPTATTESHRANSALRLFERRTALP